MGKFFVRLFALVGGLAVLALAVGVVAVLAVRRMKTRVPAKTVLELNLETAVLEYVPDDPVARVLLKDSPTLRDITEGLERASGDDRVAGLVATLGASRLGVAQIQEIRDAVLAFRAKKKFAVAFAETFGEAGPGTGAYYLATAFDEIWLQPSGDVGLTGIVFESPFVRGTLDKVGITPRMDHRHEYKNAMNLFTERKFTAAHKEASEKVMASWFSQMVRGIADARHLTQDEVRSLVDRGPFLGAEAQSAKLVDGLGYRDEVYEKAKARAGQGAQLLYLAPYSRRAGPLHARGKTIALIHGVGGVFRGKSAFNPVSGDFRMGSDTVAAAFRAAGEDKDVKAILFRVDSPGGSYVASDAIWRETLRARKAGKPVIVSMGNLAGSGGYFVAMAADTIVAEPGTITASIGVLGGKFLTSGLWDKLGLSWDEVHTSANATMWTGTHDYNATEWARFQAGLDRVYTDFTSKVAEGRRLPKEKVLEIAKGRIWTGEDAKALGLVDELGGMSTALRLAKKAARIPDAEDVDLKEFPLRKAPLQRILEGGPESSEGGAAAAALAGTLEAVRPAVRSLKQSGLFEDTGILTMPPLEIQP